jgi:hypothetical protein
MQGLYASVLRHYWVLVMFQSLSRLHAHLHTVSAVRLFKAGPHRGHACRAVCAHACSIQHSAACACALEQHSALQEGQLASKLVPVVQQAAQCVFAPLHAPG